MAEKGQTTTRWGRVPAWWLLHPAVGADQFCVLAALATYADEHGVCVPSQATLAQHLRRSRPWVNRVVAQLAASGFLEKTGRSRANGGTTSCMYRLRLTLVNGAVPDTNAPLAAKPTQPPPDVNMTRPMPHANIPCQADDRNQLNPEQNNTPASHAAPPSGDVDIEVPPDWEPSTAETTEALRLCPGADLPVHVARFRARCRARGYRYRTGRLGDAWLAWLLEDHGAASSRACRTPPRLHRTADGPVRSPPSPALRFAAWAASAAMPPAPTRATSPWS